MYQYLSISNRAGQSIYRSELMLTKNFLHISLKHDPRCLHTNFEQKRTPERGETSILVRFGNFFTFSWKNQPKVGFEWFCRCVQKIITFDSEKLFPSGLKHWMNGDVNFQYRKIVSKKCHGSLFLELDENQSVSTGTFSRYTAAPNPDAKRWVPSYDTIGLGYPHYILIPKESVQTARIYTGDGPKATLGSWPESVYMCVER